MKIALLISGGGTTAAIIKACKNNNLLGVIPSLVIASKEGIGGIQKARDLGIKEEDIIILNPKSFSNSEEYGEAIITECKKRNVDFIGQLWLAS